MGLRSFTERVRILVPMITIGSLVAFGSNIATARTPQDKDAGREVSVLVTADPHGASDRADLARVTAADFVVLENGQKQEIVSVLPAEKAPLSVEILIQDNLVQGVANEIRGIQRFIENLPDGSRVMTGYLTVGSVHVQQDFTTDRAKAADSLRIPLGNDASAPTWLYSEVVDAIKKLDAQPAGRKVLLVVSDGLDLSRGLTDASPALATDLDRAIREAQTRGIVASYHKGRQELEIACATQSVHETKNFFARYVQIPEGHVHVTARDVGGGFGQKMFVYREECAIVLASYLLGRPVKWIEDRRENLLSAGHSRNEFAHVKVAVDDDGVIQAIAADHVCDVGAYAACPAGMDPMLLPGPYKTPRLGFSIEMVWTNTMGKSAYRGPWMFETTAREMAIDHTAAELGIDPAEFRRRNLLAAGDLPFTAPSGNVFQEITPLETLEQALEILDYEAFRKEQAEARAQGRHLGVGICSYVEPTSMGSNTLATEAATVKVETSGRVIAYLGTTAHGQSIETTMAQIVAEHLGEAAKVAIRAPRTLTASWPARWGRVQPCHSRHRAATSVT